MAWLKRQPEIEVATRDRSNIYREGLAKGAPDAVQVTDRWHLLHNLALVLEEFLLQKRPVLRETAMPRPRRGERGRRGSRADEPEPPEDARREAGGGGEEAPRAPRRAVAKHPTPLPRRGRPQGHLLSAQDRRPHCLPLQGPRGAASATDVQEEVQRALPHVPYLLKHWNEGCRTTASVCTGNSGSGATPTARRPAPASPPSSAAQKPRKNRHRPCPARGGAL